jgi:exopolyphosphatase / guanosine-5'-triphosphate,3'-diphosphate pyrophosphatase
MRVAVVDIGTNSTRLLIADVDPQSEAVEALERRSQVTRLGHGVDSSGALADDAMQRVFNTLADYRALIDQHKASANLAVLTSAVRDAANGAQFAERVRNDYGLDARVLSGEQEAQLTFLGAMSGRPIDAEPSSATPSSATPSSATPSSATPSSATPSSATPGSATPGSGAPALAQSVAETDAGGGAGAGAGEPTVVVDIGGGSTEFVIGIGHSAGFHTSLHAGVVRMSERHIHSDPPSPSELQALAADVRRVFLDGLPAHERAPVKHGIAVAGTATSAASIDQELEPYDPARVHGYILQLSTVELLLARLADMNEQQRREVVGLHPDRAPTIVAGMILLEEAMRAFELEQVEVSEHDILYGGALQLARNA